MVQKVMEKESELHTSQAKGLYENVKNCKIPINVRFGHSVHMVRLERRISQDALASRAQVSRNYLSDLERGKRNISLEVVERIATALDVEVVELFY